MVPDLMMVWPILFLSAGQVTDSSGNVLAASGTAVNAILKDYIEVACYRGIRIFEPVLSQVPDHLKPEPERSGYRDWSKNDNLG